jgi:flagellar biosynthesis/type III secretory pathway protein FliH
MNETPMHETQPPAHETTVIAPVPVQRVKRHGPLFWVSTTLLGVFIVAAAVSGAFLYGRETRLSDGEVEVRLAKQASHDGKVWEERQARALARQKKTLKKSFDKRLEREVSSATQTGQSQGYASGQSEGYNSGKAKGRQEGEGEGWGEGFDSGYELGLTEGYDQGYDEGYDLGSSGY